MKIVEFKVRCPQDNALHDALAHVSDDGFVLFTECHKSWECEACSLCKSLTREKYIKGEIFMGVMEKPL